VRRPNLPSPARRPSIEDAARTAGARVRRGAKCAAVAFLLALAATPPLAAADSPRDRASWWIREYGPFTADRALVERATAIFRRVAAAADKSGNRLPKLLLINAKGEPWALSLPDGSVVVTRGALELTLGKAKGEAGDARLAFVLGHELAHLAKDDFWHASAFSALAKYDRRRGDGKQPETEAQSTLGLLQTTPRDLQSAEHQADAYGMLYASWAGYSPQTLLEQPDSFFAQWSRATGLAEDVAHPSAAARANFLRSQLAEVAEDLDYFHFGVRLLELGRYDDALLLLERFQDRFASREVFTNLGLVHHQMALRELARCDGQVAMRFALPVEADPVTLAERSRLRGAADPADVCREAPAFREHWTAARRLLELGRDRDPTYLPARIDLIATLLLGGRHAEAIVVSEEALELDPEASALLNGRALGIYLFGLESRLETTDTALGLLDQALRNEPGAPAVLWNRARILDERGRTAAARDAWRAYLAVDATGPRAEIARQRADITASPSPSTPAAVRPAPPLPLGEISVETTARLRGLARQPFVLGDFRGAFLRGRMASPAAAGAKTVARSVLDVSALQIGSALELVEVLVAPAVPGGAERFGTPLRRVATPRGDVLVYTDFAAVLERGALTALLHFAPAPRPGN
jgi:tetratricopeptide (TPR) repeat protein